MRILKYFVALAVVVALLGAGVVALAVWHFGRGLPDYQQLADYQPAVVTRVHAGDGRLLAEYATERRIFVPVSAMPPLVIRAFISAEDKNFYSHMGIDPVSILRAAATDALHLGMGAGRRPIGASTITQQVAKNFLLSSEVSMARKVKEALLAVKIERALSKDRILELYLNEIYLGSGAYGVGAAALQYFNKSLDDLTVAEAAYLAALPKAPNNYNLQRFPEAAKARRDWVIDRMAEEGYVTAAEAAAAKAEPLASRRRDETETVQAGYFAEEVRRELLARYGDKGLYQSGLSVRTSLDPQLQAVAEKAFRDGLIAYDRRHGWRGPVTHLDVSGDGWARALAAVPRPAGAGDWMLAIVLGGEPDGGAAIGFADGTRGRIPLDDLKWARPTLEDQRVGPPPRSAADVVKPGDVVLVDGPLHSAASPPPAGRTAAAAASPAGAAAVPAFALKQVPNVSGGFVAMDPHTGRILALVGGYSYDMSQFDRAFQAKRQPGSSFKPFVYLAALDHAGFNPSSLILDAPFVVDQGPGLPKWKPTNYNTTRFSGPTPLRVGIEQSKNMMTARLGQVVGLDTVADYVERFGVMDQMPRQYAMLLGAGETTVMRMTTAYSMLVNGGKRIKPTLIDRIQDRNGATVFRADDRPCDGCRDVEWQGQAPPDVPDTRETVVDPRSAYQIVSIMQGVVERGTGSVVKAVGKPLAGKTGTTNDNFDNWFVGFSPDLAAGVYIGFDAPRTLGDHETGGSAAAPVFRDFMMGALKDKPGTAFRIPPGIRLVRVNPATGKPAGPGDRQVIYEAFKGDDNPWGNGDDIVRGNGDENDPGLDDGNDAMTVAEPGSPAGAAAGGGLGVPNSAPAALPASGTGGLY
ncbi:MAG TPA: penicillin-binding protein 1A [Stellaceae bacterium]